MRVRRAIAPGLEMMEQRMLLSSGIKRPEAAPIEARKAVKPFIFNGKLPLKLAAAFDPALGENAFTEVASSFREKKPFAPMGNRVRVSGALAQPGVTSADGLPSLSGSAFRLSSTKGSLVVTFSASTTDTYSFSISAGTKQLVKADGTTGTAVLNVAPETGFSLTFKTNKHSTQSSGPPPSGNLATLASVNGASSGTNGGYPNGVTLDSQGNLYGTTVNGGADGDGTVFELAKGSSAVTTVASFDGTNGAQPVAGVTLDAHGNLYGTTPYGGPGGLYDGAGTVWEIAKGSDTITTLGSFNGTNGIRPMGGVAFDAQDNLYGTTEYGGSDSSGTVWEIVKGSNAITTLASLNGTNGFPNAGVTLDAQGNIYGTGYESVWELAKGSSTVTALFSHISGAYGGVTLDAQGNLYGTTIGGGLGHVGYGSVWELSELADGSYSITTRFFNRTNGAAPVAGVILDALGDLYGTTSEGGASGDGTLWEILHGSNTITTLVSFNGTNGTGPVGRVTLDGAGNLYGATGSGGAYGFGTVWEFTVNVSSSSTG